MIEVLQPLSFIIYNILNETVMIMIKKCFNLKAQHLMEIIESEYRDFKVAISIVDHSFFTDENL